MIWWLLYLLTKPLQIWNLCLNLLTIDQIYTILEWPWVPRENTSPFLMLIKILLEFILKWNSTDQIYYYEIWNSLVCVVCNCYLYFRKKCSFIFYFTNFGITFLLLNMRLRAYIILNQMIFSFLLCVWVVLVVNLPYINLRNVINTLKWKV